MSLHFFGYLDAGTGSIVIQAIIGSVVGGAYAFRNFSKRIFRLNKFATGQEDSSPDSK